MITEGDETGIFAKADRITAATYKGEECLAAEGSIADFADLLADENITKYGYDLKVQKDLLLNNGSDIKGRLMDIELMHYLINPEKSHKIEILARTYLDIYRGVG